MARPLEAALSGVTGGGLLEGEEELPVRVRPGEALRTDPAAVRDMPSIVPGAGDGTATPLSAVADLVLAPGEGAITRRVAERANAVQAFARHGVLPEEALADIRARLDAAGFAPPPGVRLEVGDDADARASTSTISSPRRGSSSRSRSRWWRWPPAASASRAWRLRWRGTRCWRWPCSATQPASSA